MMSRSVSELVNESGLLLIYMTKQLLYKIFQVTDLGRTADYQAFRQKLLAGVNTTRINRS